MAPWLSKWLDESPIGLREFLIVLPEFLIGCFESPIDLQFPIVLL